MYKFLKIMSDIFNNISPAILSILNAFRISLQKSDVKYNSKIKGNTINILGNGPSCLSTYQHDPSSELMVVNFFAMNGVFFDLKPRHYILMDPLFFSKGEIRFNELIEKLNTINWSMVVYVPSRYEKESKSVFNNSHIQLKFVRHNPFSIFNHNYITRHLYQANLFTPRFQDVINAGIYISINHGFQFINLHGVESNGFVNYSVNEDNDVILNAEHFYGKNEINMSTNGSIKKGEFWKYVRYYSYMLESYSCLSRYAEVMECKVKNMTINSYIDAFEKNKEV